jgi:single-strand DNA-binding protein
LQTRKWQDQSGQDRYSTEVVLQGFNSQLTMLDKLGGGGGDFGSEESGGEFGSAGPSAPRKPAMAGASAGGRSGDLDDDIPF